MKIYVADPLVPGDAPTHDVNTDELFPDIGHLLWVPLPRDFGLNELDDFVHSQIEPWVIAIAEVVVLGVHPNLRGAMEVLGLLDDLHSRFDYKPLYILSHLDDRVLATHARGDEVEAVTANAHDLIRVVREADVRAVLHRPGATLPASDLVHYEGPNGNHYMSFVRVGLALRTTAELDRMSFWLAPELIGRRSILVDHWAIISLAYHAGHYVEDLIRFADSETPHAADAMSSIQRPLRVASLAGCDEEISVIAQRVRATFPGVPADDLAILVSVVSSGELVKRMIEASTAAQFTPSATAVCVTQREVLVDQLIYLCMLGEGFDYVAPDDCEECNDEQSTSVPIEKDTYLLGLSALTIPAYVTKKDAADSKEFFEVYGNDPICKVHRTHGADQRHQAFYIDIGALLKSLA